MTTLGVRLLLLANRWLPRPALPGTSDEEDYAHWEYETSGALVELWERSAGARPRRVLDLGCGLGGKTHRLAEWAGDGIEWVGLDLSQDHLRRAESYHRSVGLTEVRKVAADAARLPFPAHSFDRVLTADTLEHLPEPRTALREMHRVLRPEGRLLLLFNPWGSPRGSHLGDLLHLPWCQLLFPRPTLEAATRAAGEERARHASADEAARWRTMAEELATHFRDHVHPTWIADLRRWIAEDGLYSIEGELRVGPGPLRASPLCALPVIEELLSASYGAVLRPIGS